MHHRIPLHYARTHALMQELGAKVVQDGGGDKAGVVLDPFGVMGVTPPVKEVDSLNSYPAIRSVGQNPKKKSKKPCRFN